MGFLSDLFGGGGGGNQTVTQQTNVPEWLLPFLEQGATSAGGSLTELRRLIGGNLVAPFNPTQDEAFGLGIDRARGGGGYLPAARDQLLRTANGMPIDSFLPPEAMSGLSGFGAGLGSFLPTDALSALTGAAGGVSVPSEATDAFSSIARGGFINPAVLQRLTHGVQMTPVPVQASDAAGRMIDAELIPGSSTDALTLTANGEFLFGGQGFDQAVDAATRAARPGILSTFGRSVGGGTGGLAQTAIAQSAIDAFANQFGAERSRQLGAATELGNQGIARGQQQLSAAGLLGNLGLAGNAAQMDAASRLGSLGLNEQQMRLAGAGGLTDTAFANNSARLAGGTALAGLSDAERSRLLSAMTSRAGMLSNLSDSERARAVGAANTLPAVANADVDLLSRIGGLFQNQEQQQINAPINAQQQLLQAALSGLPISSLFGSTQSVPTQSNGMGNLLGLGSLLFSMFGGGGFGGGGGMSFGGLGAGGGIIPSGTSGLV